MISWFPIRSFINFPHFIICNVTAHFNFFMCKHSSLSFSLFFFHLLWMAYISYNAHWHISKEIKVEWNWKLVINEHQKFISVFSSFSSHSLARSSSSTTFSGHYINHRFIEKNEFIFCHIKKKFFSLLLLPLMKSLNGKNETNKLIWSKL